MQPLVDWTRHAWTAPAAHCDAPAVHSLVQHAAKPRAPLHAPPVHVMFGVWTLHPLVSFAQVINVVPLAHAGPAVPVQIGSALHVQLALPDAPVQV